MKSEHETQLSGLGNVMHIRHNVFGKVRHYVGEIACRDALPAHGSAAGIAAATGKDVSEVAAALVGTWNGTRDQAAGWANLARGIGARGGRWAAAGLRANSLENLIAEWSE